MKVNVVYGAPCSGKTTYCREHIGKNELVYDHDELARALTYTEPHAKRADAVNRYIVRIRNMVLEEARKETELGAVWLISTWIGKELREGLEGLDAEYIEMDATQEECLRRLEADESRTDKEECAEVIRRWYKWRNEKEEKKMPVKREREYRAMAALTIAENKRFDSGYYIEGYATTFGAPYELYEMDGLKYYERIEPGALDGADVSDVIMQYDHEGKVLARQSNGTLGIEAQPAGLFVYADLSKSAAAKELYEEIKNGLVTKMSWAFTIADDEYDRQTRTRIIKKIKKVYDVSAVSIPANGDTSISARTYFNGVIEAERREALGRKIKLINLITEV